MLALLPLFAVLAPALGLQSDDPPLVLSGRVVQADGSPAAGAAIGVSMPGLAFLEPFTAALPLGETEADHQGYFEIQLPADWVDPGGRSGDLQLIAYQPDQGLGFLVMPPEEVAAGCELQVVLAPHAQRALRVLDSEGEPIVGAKVWPATRRTPPQGTLHMCASWWREHAPITDADGWVALPLADELLQTVQIQARGFGQQQVGIRSTNIGLLPTEVRLIPLLERPLQIEGEVRPGLRLMYGDRKDSISAKGIEYITVVRGGHELHDDLESLRIPDSTIPLLMHSTDGQALGWSCEVGTEAGDPIVLRKSAETQRIGRVVDAVSGAPVSDVRLSIWAGNRAVIHTDERGEFRWTVGAMSAMVFSMFPPAGHVPKAFASVRLGVSSENEQSTAVQQIELSPDMEVRGRVVGASGLPVAGAFVLGKQELATGQHGGGSEASACTDAEGWFRLRRLLKGGKVNISATWAGQHGSVVSERGETVELSLEASLGLRARFVDTTGEPIEGLKVKLLSSTPNVINGDTRYSLSGRQEWSTDADGRLHLEGYLDPTKVFRLAWTADGVVRASSDWLEPKEWAEGPILTTQALHQVAGVLLDASGAPVAGVTVLTRRSQRSVTTDAEGRFSMGALADEGDVLVAWVNGVPHARAARVGEPSMTWHVGEYTGESTGEGEPPHPRQLELSLAFELLDAGYQEAIAKDASAKEASAKEGILKGGWGDLLRAVENLSWVDPALTLQRVEEGIFDRSWKRDFALADVAHALHFESPGEALAVARRITRGMSRAGSMLSSAALLDPASELEQLVLLRAESRSVDPPEHRLVVIAKLARRLLELGRGEAAAELLKEGQAVAAQLPDSEWPAYAKGVFAQVLCRVDYKASRAIVDALKASDSRERHLGNMARELAALNPVLAEKLLRELDQPRSAWKSARFSSAVVHAMGPVDLERAVRIAKRYDPTGYDLGLVALALVEQGSNFERAGDLLAQAFERARACPDRDIYGLRLPYAAVASLLPIAARVDPDGLSRWVAELLAIRRPEPDRFLGIKSAWRADGILAFFLADVDRVLARTVLAPAMRAARAAKSVHEQRDFAVVWAAAAVVDPQGAADAARTIGGQAAATVGLILAMPPAARREHVQGKLMRLWIPGIRSL